MLTRNNKAGSSVPRPNLQKQRSESNGKEIRIKRDSNRVKVFVRVRPFSEEETTRRLSTKSPFEATQDATQLHLFQDDKGHPEKTYHFDHVFKMEDNNVTVSEALTQPLVHSAMNGFNGTLMAYGQTGSGKTYSLMSEDGITKTLIDKCFEKIYDDTKHNYKVTVSYLQIYQEKIFDLLSGVNSSSKADLAIRENPRTGVYVDNLSDYVVRSPSEVLQFISNGKKKLVFAETKMNRMSSRSHAVLQMVIERTMKGDADLDKKESVTTEKTSNVENENGNEDSNELDLNAFGKDVIIRGKIHICDLAGSERIKRTGASGDRLNEAQHINSSLLELGNVIQALADDTKKHVPFRNSILTRLLQESLGGNCKTSLIVCVSPSPRDLQETKCTLNFGSRAMKVTNTAYVNMEVDFKSLSDQLLKQLQTKDDEIHTIRKNYQERLEAEKLKIIEDYEGEDGKLATMLCHQQKMMDQKMKLMEECILNLQNEADIKSNEVKGLEKAVLLMDDNSKREKFFLTQMLTSQVELTNQMTRRTISLVLNRLKELTGRHLDLEGSIKFLTSLHSEIEKLDKVEIESDEKVEIDEVKLDDCVISEQDFYTSSLKMFLRNRINYFQYVNKTIKELTEMKSQAKEEHELDQIDGSENHVGIQASKNNSVHQSSSISNQASEGIEDSSTAGECEVSIQSPSIDVTDAQSQASSRSGVSSEENNEKPLSDPPDLHTKKSHEIFSGFNSTLNRIEDLVKTDRERSPSFSRDRVGRSPSLNLSSLSSRSEVGGLTNRSDNNSYRSNSFRFEDSFTPKYTSPYTTAFSGSSTARGNSNVYESKYTPRSSYGSSLYSSSIYESSRNFGGGGSLLNRYASSENLMSSDLKSGFRGSSNDLSLSMTSRNETRRLEDKVRELEAKVKEVEQENNEYSTLVGELSRNFPNDDQLREIKRKVTGKIAQSIVMYRKESVKVARIEPFSSDSKRSNSINVKYDFTDGKSIPKDCDNKNVTYDIHVNVVRNMKKVSHASSPHNRDNLIEFSPSVEQTPVLAESSSSSKSLSANVFEELERRKSWNGGEPDKQESSSRDSEEEKEELLLGNLDGTDPYQSNEVIFSSKKSSSLSLPDWMKLKRKPSNTESHHVVKDIIQ